MAEDKSKQPEEVRGSLVSDVVVPVLSSGVGGAVGGVAGAWAQQHFAPQGQAPSEAAPPSVELPPGVDPGR